MQTLKQAVEKKRADAKRTIAAERKKLEDEKKHFEEEKVRGNRFYSGCAPHLMFGVPIAGPNGEDSGGAEGESDTGRRREPLLNRHGHPSLHRRLAI